MEYNKNMFDPETIPDYALQPAKPAEEFDAAAYDHLYRTLAGEKESLPVAPVEPILAAETFSEAEEEPEVTAFSEPDGEPVAVATIETIPAAPVEPALVMETEPVEELTAAEYSEPVGEVALEEASEEPPEEEPASGWSAILPASLLKAELDKVRRNVISIPDPATIPTQSKASVKSDLPANSQKEKTLAFADFIKHKPISLHVEEEILIPDVKPDMVRLLCSEGRCRLSETAVSAGSTGIQSLRISGDLNAQTLYVPAGGAQQKMVISMESRIPFREEIPFRAGENSLVTLDAELLSVEVERINERKFRIKADVQICPREYRNRELTMFDGFSGEVAECRREPMKLMDIAFRKTETLEFSEELKLKEGMPDIDKILCCNVHVVENHKQINREKAVVNATAFLNILYEDEEPVLYQGKTDFTQFIKVDDENAFSSPLLGSRVNFCIRNLSVEPNKDDQGDCRIFHVSMDIDTTMEYYREIEEPAVTDFYHLEKEARHELEPVEVNCIYGNSLSEATAREIINIPEQFSGSPKVVYLSGTPAVKRTFVEQGKCIVEGVIPVTMVCLPGEGEGDAFCLKHNLEFRSAMDFPGASPDMEPDTEIALKELWFDAVNSRQIEVNAGIAVSANLFGRSRHNLIRTVSLEEPAQTTSGQKQPGIIVYITSAGDSTWKVGKKYRIPIKKILDANGMAEENELKAGTKLLILK